MRSSSADDGGKSTADNVQQNEEKKEKTSLPSWTFSVGLGLDDQGTKHEHKISQPESQPALLNLPQLPTVPSHIRESFENDGFAVFPNVLDKQTVAALNQRLCAVLNGHYDRNQGQPPDKVPRCHKFPLHTSRQTSKNKKGREKGGEKLHCDATTITSSSTTTTNITGSENGDSVSAICKDGTHVCPLGVWTGKIFSPKGKLLQPHQLPKPEVLQIINIHKADTLFRQLAKHPAIGKVVADLMNSGLSKKSMNAKSPFVTEGVRLAQDQVWAKPPGAPGLAFHRDSPYFMFEPDDVITVWIALDDMDDPDVGPLEYVKGSHRWHDNDPQKNGHQAGATQQFFSKRKGGGGKAPLIQAAAAQGLEEEDLEWVSMATDYRLQAGGIAIHHGNMWHGSGRNQSTQRRLRRGLGLHVVPASVHFTADAVHSQLWKPYVESALDDLASMTLPEEDFPIVWQPHEAPCCDD